MPTSLEDRVKALEEEVNILKDEIRNTLLEIQEQVLIHYYPELRAKDAAPPEAALVAQAGPLYGPVPFRGLQRISAAELQEEATNQGAAPVGTEALLAPQGEGGSVAPADEGSWSDVARLTEWASDSVERIGRERTVKAIEIAAQAGYLSPDDRDLLVRLVSLSDAEPAVERVTLKTVGEVLQRLSQAVGRQADKATEQRFLREVRLG